MGTKQLSIEFGTLVEGYRRFRAGDWQQQHDRWAELSEGQSPKVMVISCSDSRVDPSQIFDVNPGELFVVRNVAALVPPYQEAAGQHGVSAALEFAVQFLGVKEVLVMGHGMCGGCQAALSHDLHGNELGQGGFVAKWISMLDDIREPIAKGLGTTTVEAERAMEHAAVKLSLENLRSFSFVKEKEDGGELNLRGCHFSIADGILYQLDEGTGKFGPVE